MIKLTVAIILVLSINCFYIYLTPASAQCFFNSVYKDERLLVEVETPIISLMHKIVMTTYSNNATLIQQEIINQAKFTVPRPTNIITNEATTDSMEYSTCFEIVTDPTPSKDDKDNPIIPKKGYLLSIKLFTNFQHKLQLNKEKGQASANWNYKQLTKMSKRLKEINSQQISLHQINEVKQKLSQFYLQNLKGRVILYSMLEIVMVIVFTLIQVKTLQGYLNNLSIV